MGRSITNICNSMAPSFLALDYRATADVSWTLGNISSYIYSDLIGNRRRGSNSCIVVTKE